jgi:hypothetical protein
LVNLRISGVIQIIQIIARSARTFSIPGVCLLDLSEYWLNDELSCRNAGAARIPAAFDSSRSQQPEHHPVP